MCFASQDVVTLITSKRLRISTCFRIQWVFIEVWNIMRLPVLIYLVLLINFFLFHNTSGAESTFTFEKNRTIINDQTHHLQNKQSYPSSAIDDTGNIYIVWVEESDVMFSKSKDNGKTFSTPVKVNDVSGCEWDSPKVAVDKNGKVYVAWLSLRQREWGPGDLRISASTDGGSRFTSSSIVNDDRKQNIRVFPAITIDGKNTVYVSWLDRREKDPDPDKIAHLYFAKSTDGSKRFTKNIKINAGTPGGACDCCQPAINITDGIIYAAWRNTIHNVRDIYVARSEDSGNTFSRGTRVSGDNWSIEGCPNSGPSLAVDGRTIYTAWMTVVSGVPRVFIASSNNGGETFSSRAEMFERDANHPSIAIDEKGRIFAVWEYIRRDHKDIVFAVSYDSGRTFVDRALVNDDDGKAQQELPTINLDQNGKTFILWTDYRLGNSMVFFAKNN